MLASTCCFAKQTTFFYSIAQHDYLVSMIVPPDDALAALLADARTALEQLLPQCFETDGDAATYILARLGLPSGLPSAVEQADLVLRATERHDLGRAHDAAVAPLEGVRPLPLKIQPLPPLVAKHLFLDRYYELRPQRSPSASPVPEGAS
ncbi:metal-dependent phosphohydrolase [Aromatoleum aromaticum]|uniref:metal-dependent phosphohydrolase n=1 Tax=Aromatoleum aromaticum TaxID=551760 RepID=UPI0012FEEA1C|nr:metal-dependent phosphohydrolase [Aromatoleum aromaticum]